MTTAVVLVALLAVMLTTYDLTRRIGAHEERQRSRCVERELGAH